MLSRVSVLLFCLLFTAPAHADDYAEANFANVARTLVRFNAIDIKDDALIDDYAMITDCELFQYFYADDFKWNQTRAAIRQSISLNIASFPTQYRYDSKIQLGRYDFKQKNFHFTDRATVRNVNTFLLVEKPDYHCGSYPLKYMPFSYHAVLDVPVTVPGLPFAENDADALLQRMNDSGNTDHVVYARFRLRVVNVDPLRRLNAYGNRILYSQNAKSSERTMRLDVRLDSIDFYEDEDMTKLIYTYRP